ncbi:MAG: DUF177 domain-containing protein [Actinomycetota bacterium]|nr:DUF177 domain-containing protein [Actinomycetota bacterium]
MASVLRVNAAEVLRRPGTEKVFDLPVQLADLEIEGDSRFYDGDAVQVHLRLESLTDGIVVDGRLLVPWHGTCRRCLADTGGVLECEVHELYQRTLTDPDAFELEGDQLDLQPLVRELVLLDTPATPLCRPDCAGLCPTCGVNRNETPCKCVVLPSDPRWDGLAGLKDLLPPE